MAEEIKHVPPVTLEVYAKHGREQPNIKIKKVGVFPLVAPADGFVEEVINNKAGDADTIIFRHDKEPYYSMLSEGNNMIATLLIGQKVLAGVLLGTVDDQVSWRVGAIGNTNDWLDPDEWLKGNYQIWGQSKDVKKLSKGKTDWGTIALYVGGAYLLLKGTSKK